MAKFNKKAAVRQAVQKTNKKSNCKKPKSANGKKEYGTMSLDEFMETACQSGDSSGEETEKIQNDSLLSEDIENQSEVADGDEQSESEEDDDNEEEQSIKSEQDSDDEDEEEVSKDNNDVSLWGEDEELDEENSGNEYEDEMKNHKKSLQKLKESDPEFYKFLQENDKKLLEFNVSDGESENDDDDEEKVHVPTGDLDIASDESDFEDEKSSGKNVVTLKLLKKWQSDLQTDKTNNTIRCVIDAFHAAMLRVSNKEDENFHYKVEGSSVFNGVIQLCVLELSPAIRKYLGIKSSKVKPHKCKKFPKLKSLLQGYFTDLIKLLGGVASTSIYTVLLKHLHHLSILLISFPNLSKVIVKKLIRIWGTGEETVKVLAFFCIFRITNNHLVLLDTVLKSMYMTYVMNSKFVSPRTLSSINFMRRSLAEMFCIDLSLSYRHVFFFLRQLAIHLRKAIVSKEKKNTQAVYNWQFINSLKLWGHLLSIVDEKSPLKPLEYPFGQICQGTIKLHPIVEYYPLRFHVVQIMMDFSKQTGVFIPVLPYILEVLTDYDFNKKHKKASMKPIHFTFLLHLSASQKLEKDFKDNTIDTIYGLLMEYLASKSHSIAFPDLAFFCVYQLKQFIKKCTIANYTKKMKQVLEKIYENNRFIETERKSINFNLNQEDKIKVWETQVLNKGTPLNAFYENLSKMRDLKKKKRITNNEKLGEYNLPVLKKFQKTVDPEEANKPADPFPDSDPEDDYDFEKKVQEKLGGGKTEEVEEEAPSKKRKKKKNKNQEQDVVKRRKVKDEGVSEDVAFDGPIIDDDDDQEDVVEDLDLSDF